MKATVIAVFVALLAVASAFEYEILEEGPFGKCPRIDEEKPVYLMDNVHRDVFYKCSNRNPIRQTCAGGLVFDPRKNVCSYPSTESEPYGPVGNCPSDDIRPYPKVYLRDGANMAVYYFCWREVNPWKYQCPEGKYFKMSDMKCRPLAEQ